LRYIKARRGKRKNTRGLLFPRGLRHHRYESVALTGFNVSNPYQPSKTYQPFKTSQPLNLFNHLNLILRGVYTTIAINELP